MNAFIGSPIILYAADMPKFPHHLNKLLPAGSLFRFKASDHCQA